MAFTTKVRDSKLEHLTRRKMITIQGLSRTWRPRFRLAQVVVVLVTCALVCGETGGESSLQSPKYFPPRHGVRALENNKLRLHPSTTSREFSYPQGSSRAKTLQRIISQRRRVPSLRDSAQAAPPVSRFTYSSDGSQNVHKSSSTTQVNSNPGPTVGLESHFSQRSGKAKDVFNRGMYEDADAGRSFALGSMIEQLSSALHRSLVRNRAPAPSEAAQGRRQVATPKQLSGNRQVSGDGLGGGNELYASDPLRAGVLPECATQQVCNAVYVRLNMTQPLCSCPTLTSACSASVSADDKHTIELKMGRKTSKAVTLIKTCEPVWSVRDCRAPRDWSILALQNTRTGKAHYLVICKCPDGSKLDGPLNHDQPSYAQVPGIRVYGMMCVSASLRAGRFVRETPSFPWSRAVAALTDQAVLDDLFTEDAPVPDAGPGTAASDATQLQLATAKFLDLLPEHDLMELEGFP